MIREYKQEMRLFFHRQSFDAPYQDIYRSEGFGLRTGRIMMVFLSSYPSIYSSGIPRSWLPSSAFLDTHGMHVDGDASYIFNRYHMAT